MLAYVQGSHATGRAAVLACPNSDDQGCGYRLTEPNIPVERTAHTIRLMPSAVSVDVGRRSPEALVFCKKCKFFFTGHTSGD
jgi:hypothetical protein